MDTKRLQKLLLPRGYQQAAVLQKRYTTAEAEVFVRNGRERAFGLFKQMAVRVPAYGDFLKNYGIEHKKIKSYRDLAHVPAVDKDNYLRKYPKELLCWDGSFGKGAWVISTTSGSTGEPYFFPRQISQDMQYAVSAEQYLLSNFKIDSRKTLYIVGFPMGAWIGGVFTYEAIKSVADKGYNLSIITPGIHKAGIINAVKQLAGSYDQVIIGAYAPFLRDILDDGERAGINWKQLQVKFIFSAEAFSEQFRDYVANRAGLHNIYLDTLNHYGTVDLGTMAHETPVSIWIRRYLFAHDKATDLLPERHKQPTFAQYDPSLFYFEEKDNNLYCSAYSGIPLFRYNLKDYGGVISYAKVENYFQKKNVQLHEMMAENGAANTLWKLPFVYVYERNDFSVSYYAFNVYPEPIRKALQATDLSTAITGKFTMSVEYDTSGSQHLYIVVECTHQTDTNSEDLIQKIREIVHQKLLDESTEYPELHKMKGEEAKPIITLRPYEDEEYFKPGTKQRWVKK